MKFMKPQTSRTLIGSLALALALTSLTGYVANAHPYASGVTNNSGTIHFIMNEGGATVNVVFEDNTTNAMGVLPKGATNFLLGAHTSYQIICTKAGNGTPALISTDTDQFSVWNSPRGVAVNQNPALGYLFGRTYVGNSAVGGTAPYAKGHGLYALNADQTEALGSGTNAAATATFANSGTSGPYKMRVAPDNTILVDDFSTASAALWQFQPDLSNSNLVLSIIGQTASVAAGIHGDFFGTPLLTGSLAGGNLVLWTADSGMGAPGTATLGPGTSPNSFNCLFRYDIGSGPLPWNHPPNYAYTMGLDGIPELRTELELGKDGKVMAGFGRANLSNPDIQILDPTGTTILYTSWQNTGGTSDPWAGVNGSGGAVGTYCGIRVSPDGRFLASVDINNGITLAFLTNGIPDEGSIFGIQNAPNVGNSRGMAWDAADNIYVCSSGQGLLRVYSLGITTTCITSNDFTGTNGTFQLILPSVSASIVATTPQASQNYGTPIPGVFRISLNQSTLATPLTVNFARSGTAVLSNHYNFNYGTNADGVVISSNSVTFPAGAYPHAGNWSVALTVTPTATPLSTNTLTAILKLSGGPSYQAVAPVKDTVFIQNTGPQLLLLTAASSGTTMYRGITNDYAKFVITRLGDTNGPGNSASSITPLSYTITNVTYLGTAAYPSDYTARAQRIDPAGNGVIVPPVGGPTAIVINPGDTLVTCVVGDPILHNNFSAPPTNLTIIVNLTNAVACPACTNLTSQEGLAYTVGTATTTLTEIDNAVGPEVVLYSNPLISSADSTNWTLTFAATNFGSVPQLPVVVPNYTNDATSIAGGGTNDFLAEFGFPVANDSVTPSPVMAANGWANVLKMTVNKNNFAQAGVNVYPQGKNFSGNYALRFNMYLSLYDFAFNNPNIGSAAREYALFGINHYGTNCNWRTDAPISAGTGNSPTNSDGQWFAIDAGSGGITPADFDGFLAPPLPNPGVTVVSDKVSNPGLSQNGVFKHPPLPAMNVTTATVSNPGGGEPVNQWVDVSVEITMQTNINLFINRSQVLPSFPLTNGLLSTSYTNGTIMLGYLDPNRDVSDSTAFAYFSNVRVVELSPSILAQPASLIVTQGANVSFTSSANLGTAPVTNTWYLGNPPVVALQTNTANATNLTSTLSLANVQSGASYVAVFSDAAGSVTGLVANLEVIQGPTNAVVSAGATFTFNVTPTGPSAPTSFQWKFNGVNLANNAHFAGVTSSALTITNVQPADAGTYSVAVVNPAGTVTPAATLALPVVTPAAQTNLWGSTASFTVTAAGSGPFTYQWKTNGVNLTNSAHYGGVTTSALSISNVTRADALSYTAGVTNAAGGAVSSAGVLTVLVPPPTITGVSLSGGNVVLSFSSTNNIYDNTNAFILQSAGVVTGPYTNTPGSFTTSGGTFQVTAPRTGSQMFYRLLHVN